MNLLEINTSKLLEVLGSDIKEGLTEEQAERNRAEFSKGKEKSIFRRVIEDTLGDVMTLAFIVLSIISVFFSKDWTAIFALALFIFVYIGFKIYAYRYTAKITKTVTDSKQKVKVVREGEVKELQYSSLAPGDIILLGFGDVVPSDALVLEQSTLRVSEIQLTGKSVPVIKIAQEDVIRGKGVPYYQCILFAGSVIMSGYARAIVCNTGKDVFDKKNRFTSRSRHARHTKLYEIASFISKNISLMWIIISALIFITGVVRGENPFNVFYLAVSLALLSFPDFALTLFDLTLSVGSKRLDKKRCVVRDLSTIDRMCDISCIAVDNSRYFRTSSPRPNTVYVNSKTKKFRGAQESDVKEIFSLALLASVSEDEAMVYNGTSFEKSLISAGEDIGITRKKLLEEYLILEKKAYDKELQMSRVIYFKDGEFYTVSLGSPWAVLKSCYYNESQGEKKELFEKEKRSLRELAHNIAEGNEGVVAIAVKKIEYKEGAGQIESRSGFTFKGFIGLHTSIKADSARAVSACVKSSVDVILMSDEPKFTSIGVAKSLSIMKDKDKEITEKEFLALDEGLFRTEIKDYKVYVLFSPEEKARVVSMRKGEGDIVAAAVSSVDDLRLLIESDVSFASEDISDKPVKENSDVVLRSGFELIPECIKYARAVYRNTRHMLEYFVNYQFILLFVTLIPFIFNKTFLITPSAMVAYSILASLPLSVSLAIENIRGNELKETFGKENQGLNIHNLMLIPAISAFVTGVLVTLSDRFSGGGYVTLVSSAVFMAWALSIDDTFDTSVFKNKELIISSLAVFIFMFLFLYTPLNSLIGIKAPTFLFTLFSIFTGMLSGVITVTVKLLQKYITKK